LWPSAMTQYMIRKKLSLIIYDSNENYQVSDSGITFFYRP
jgi:hypothetical protein